VLTAAVHPGAFLDLPPAHADPVRAAVCVLPLPFEGTVTFGRGTAGGPAAILAASAQVEWYDREFDREVALDFGIHTATPPDLPADAVRAVDAIATRVALLAGGGKLVVGLGGEHTVSIGVARGLLAARGGPITVVQIDAHSDLRDIYEGNPLSHACTARRILDDARVEQVLQLGVRSVCPEEVAFHRAHPDRVRVWYAEDVHSGAWPDELVARVRGRRVFLTIDVDGLDPSVVSATGTPEPDGLSWTEALDVMRAVAGAAEIVGIDAVELAPQPGQHAADFAVAKLVYKAIAYAMLLGRERAREST
jgi:agmatinase